MEPTLVFTKQTISRTSTTTGANIDFFSAPASSLVHAGAAFGELVLFFKDSNIFSDNSITGGASTKAADYAKVTLKVRAGTEVKTIEFLNSLISKSSGKVIRFDNTLRQYDVRGVLQVLSIARTDLPTDDDIYLSCGTGGSFEDIDPGIIDVANDLFLFYDADDNGLPKVESITDFVAAIAGDNLTAVNGVLNASEHRVPGGDKFAVLAKSSDTDYDYDWTESPTFEDLNISKWSTSDNPTLLFSRSQGADHTTTTTAANDILGEIGFRGVSLENNNAVAGKIKVTQTQPSTSSNYVQSKLELFTGTKNGEEVALTINDERVTILPNQNEIPSAVQGGLYADNNDKLFFGVS
jgi:hypothetical protein